jgi:phage/plasmid primase-like uncharacterized protein
MIDAQLNDARNVRIETELARRGTVLKRAKRYLVGPCPVCGGTDRFSVNLEKQLWNCRNCKKGGDVIDLAQHLDGCSFIDAVETLTGERFRGRPGRDVRARPEPPKFNEDDAAGTKYALRLWREAKPLIESPAWLYLTRPRRDGGRDIDLDVLPDVHSVLRWHPNCPWGGVRHGCMLALWTDVITGEPKAIHRRAITMEGKKVDVWKALGPTTGCCIRLWADEHVTTCLVIGEGPETVMSAATRICHRGALLQPAWACGDRGHLSKFPVLPGVECLIILVDRDANQDGQNDAAECAGRWTAAGREVRRLIPDDVDTDFNDLVSKAWS